MMMMSQVRAHGIARYSPQHPAHVLLVDDDEDDATLTREGFVEAGIPARLSHVRDGRECLSYLRRLDEFTDATEPNLILLDLNMPRVDGWQVLDELIHDPALCHIPVVVLTTSAAKSDIMRLYQLRCSAFMIKPTDFDEFVRAIRVMGDFWFSVIELPCADQIVGRA